MFREIGVLALAVFICSTVPKHAWGDSNQLDARNLLKVCTTPAMHWVDFCNGFFQAVHDFGVETGKVCTPAGVTRTNLVSLYEQRAALLIAREAAVGGRTGFAVAFAVIEDAYPCKK
ncbi:MAG: hypothetical protein AB7U75_19950 [Hyphomicrobiaceae bacterium]